jgi:hypothetical protein
MTFRSVLVFLLEFGPVLGCKIRARLQHDKTLVDCSVDRFCPGKAQQNISRPVRLGWKRDTPPPRVFVPGGVGTTLKDDAARRPEAAAAIGDTP